MATLIIMIKKLSSHNLNIVSIFCGAGRSVSVCHYYLARFINESGSGKTNLGQSAYLARNRSGLFVQGNFSESKTLSQTNINLLVAKKSIVPLFLNFSTNSAQHKPGKA